MAEKNFGVKKLDIIGSGTPTIANSDGGDLNINAATSTFSGNLVLGGNLTVNGTTTTLDTNLIDVDKVEVATAGTNVAIAITQSGTGDLIRLYDGTSQVVTVDDEGNIGIGENTPSEKLDVNGTVKATTFSGSGASLTSIPAGNLTGTVADARISTLTASKLTGALPAISGANLTNLPGGTPADTDPQIVFDISASGTSGFIFTGPGNDGSTVDPDIYLMRGQRYRFINTTGSSHPFEFRNADNTADFTDGITGSQSGTQDFNVQYDAPAHLKYRCTIHTGSMVGNIYIRSGADTGASAGTENIEIGGFLRFDNTVSKIVTDTSDGSDNKAILITGGGDTATSRGAVAVFYGNELNSGGLALYSGVGGGDITFNTGTTTAERLRIESDGNVRVSDEHLRFDTTGKGIIFGNHGGSDRPSIIGNYTSATDNNIVFNVEGTERVRITSGDSSATNPQGYLHVTGDGDGSIKKFFTIESTHSGYFGPNLIMQHKSSSPADNDIVSQVHFNGLDDLNHITNYAAIDVQATDVSDANPKGDIIFSTRKDNVGTIEKLRITSSGHTLPGADNTYDLGSSAKRWDDVYATNGTIQTSDRNYKENILESDLGLDFINKLSPKSFKFKGKTRTHYGLIAQDIETVITDLGKTTTEFAPLIKTTLEDETTNYGLRYTEFISPIIKAIQELKAENDSLKARIATLEGS